MKKQIEKRKFGYIRVSSKTQNEARQIDALLNEGVLERDIFIDKQSGKDFSRPAYQNMIQSLQQGDEVVILDLDRLGRNYSETATPRIRTPINPIIIAVLFFGGLEAVFFADIELTTFSPQFGQNCASFDNFAPHSLQNMILPPINGIL